LNPTVEELRFDDPCWSKVEARLEALFRRSDMNLAWFEQEGYEVLRESVELRVPRDWVDVSLIAHYQCGSLRYNCFAPGSRVDAIPIHIANTLQPESMFREPGYLACCLVELMRQTEERNRPAAAKRSHPHGGVGDGSVEGIERLGRHFGESLFQQFQIIGAHQPFGGGACGTFFGILLHPDNQQLFRVGKGGGKPAVARLVEEHLAAG